MEFYEAINKRRTVRDWSDRPVSEEALKRILDAGLAAPSNNHLRSWEFIVLHDDEEKETALAFVKAWAEAHGQMKGVGISDPAKAMYAYALPRQYTMLKNAPYVILPLFQAGPKIFHADAVNELNSFASIWCVIENIFLAAAAEGMACSMRIPVGQEGSNVCKSLDVPEGYVLPCYIGLGWPAEDIPELEQHTYTAEQKIHKGKW